MRIRLWNILEKEGKTLAALNAALFTSELDSRIAGKIVLARKTVADKVIRNYCLAKGLVVAVNPVPVADLLAAAEGPEYLLFGVVFFHRVIDEH